MRAERAAPNTDSHGERREGVEEGFHGGSLCWVVVLGYRDFGGSMYAGSARREGTGPALPPTIQLPRPKDRTVSEYLILRHVIRVCGDRGSLRKDDSTVT